MEKKYKVRQQKAIQDPRNIYISINDKNLKKHSIEIFCFVRVNEIIILIQKMCFEHLSVKQNRGYRLNIKNERITLSHETIDYTFLEMN